MSHACCGLYRVTGDRYSAAWVVETMPQSGISYEHSQLTRSELYLECLPLLNSRKLKLLDIRKTVGQFANLERRTARCRTSAQGLVGDEGVGGILDDVPALAERPRNNRPSGWQTRSH
jgi:hypothetical protein